MATLALLVISVDVPRRNQLYSRRRITYMDGELMLSPRLQVTTCGCCWGYGPMFESYWRLYAANPAKLRNRRIASRIRQSGSNSERFGTPFQGRLRRGDQGPSGRCMPHTIVGAYLVPEPIKIVHTTGAHDPAAGGVPALPSDLHGRPSVSCRHAAGLVRLLGRRGKATSSSSKPPASTARAGST